MATSFTQISKETGKETSEDRGESHNKSGSLKGSTTHTTKTDLTSMLSSRDEVQQDLIYETAMSPLRVWLKVREPTQRVNNTL